MTSIAETAPRRGPAWARTVLLLLALALMALETPAPWWVLWLAVPATVALALLACWRYGVPAVIVTSLLAVAATVLGSAQGLWAWWLPAGALVGATMGVREEGGGPSPGQRGWMLAPTLALAACLPWLPHYHDLVSAVERELRVGDAQFLEVVRQLGAGADRLAAMQKTVSDNATLRHQALPHVLPTVLFVWVALLTVAGRALAARLAGALSWPRLSRLRLSDWRLPDGALWTFIAGLALLVSPWPAWAPTGWTLLLNTGLGYCVQGVAVVQSLLLARGVPPSIIILTLLFVFMIAMPMFVLTTAALGLSDVWLDYRRLEPVPDGDQNPGEH